MKQSVGGKEPKSYINPVAIEAMKEIGIDISGQKAKAISEDMIRESFRVINMGCMQKENGPTYMAPKMIDWNIEDPKDQSIEKVREMRDEIEQKVKELVSQLN